MRCEEVRPVLPAYDGDELEGAGGIEVHLATCGECAAELARYRELASAVQALREAGEDPPAEFVDRVLALAPHPRIRDDLLRLARDHPRAQTAALSLGGAMLGAAAMGVVWWRAARRKLGAPGLEIDGPRVVQPF